MTAGLNPLMSIDVEDWFHVDNLKAAIPRESWEGRESRVERNVSTILEILSANGTKGTFFILGWVGERFPHLVREIAKAGHELGAHGYGHDLVYDLTPARFKEDLARTKSMLENVSGSPVIGYRAPNFSITDWAIECLIELGFRYDSSLFPTKLHDRYGKLADVNVPATGYGQIRPGLTEVTLPSLEFAGTAVPWGGGAYFRFLPYPVFKAGMQRILRQKESFCFYIHPWEFDPQQPRITAVKLFYKVRHYRNLEKTTARFQRLVRDFNFVPIRQGLGLGTLP